MFINLFAKPSGGLLLPQFYFRGDQAQIARPSQGTNDTTGQLMGSERMASLIQSHLNRSLPGAAQNQPATAPTVSQDLSPQAVAERVLGFIEQAIRKFKESGASDVEIRNRLDAAREGVERGFREARHILREEGRFHGEVAHNARETHKLIQQGIDELEKGLVAHSQPVGGFKLAGQAHFSLKESVTLQVRTQEGDVVSIRLHRSVSSGESYHVEGDRDGFALAYESRSSSRAGLAVQVIGDLNEEEQEALNELLKDVDELADRFFAGNLESAFKKAQQLEFDQEDLAGFSLRLHQQASARVEAYREVAALLPTSADNVDKALPPNVAKGLAETAHREDIAEHLGGLKELSESLFAQHIQLDDRFDALREALDDVTNRLLDTILQRQPAAEIEHDGDTEDVPEPDLSEAA